MVSEQFHMNAVSKYTNWKGIIFDVTERSWKQTSRRRIEKLTWYKNEFFLEISLIFPSRGSSYASVFCFCLNDFTGWGFDSTM